MSSIPPDVLIPGVEAVFDMIDPPPKGSIEVTDNSEKMPPWERFKFGKELHSDVLPKLMKLRNRGQDAMKRRSEDWDDVDNFLQMRVDLTAGVRKGDKTRDYNRRENPYDRTLVLPVTFAMLYVRHVEKIGMLLSRDLQVEGTSPDDVRKAKLVEGMLAYGCRQMNWPMVANQISWDDERYGLTIVYDTFEVEDGWLMKPPRFSPGDLEPEEEASARSHFPNFFEPTLTWGEKTRYPLWTPVDPRRAYPDPDTTIQNLQRGQFFGHGMLRTFEYLKEREIDEEKPSGGGIYFNLDAVKENCSGRASTAKPWPGQQYRATTPENSYRVDHLQVKLIPKEWKVGAETRPQIWWFTWVDDSVIVRAHKCPYAHGRFTYAAGEGIPDYHQFDSPGWGEQLIGLQNTINYLLTSHILNVRRLLNNSMMYNPEWIYEEDLLNPTAAGHIRIAPEGVELVKAGRLQPGQLIQQLGISDLTVGNLNDITALTEWAQRAMGANDPMQGMQTKDQRTLGEIQTIMASASQRVGLSARLLDHQIIRPLVERSISNLQQLMTEKMWVRIVGDLALELEQLATSGGPIQKVPGGGVRAEIAPEDLWGNFDYIPLTLNSASDPEKNPETFIKAMQIVMNPALQTPDETNKVPNLHKFVEQILRTMGIKNVDDFFKTLPPPMPPPEMMGAGPGGMPGELPPPGAGAPPPPPGISPGPPGLAPDRIKVVPDDQYRLGVERGNYA
jgi:hypothetical protein